MQQDHAKAQAQAQLASIREMLATLARFADLDDGTTLEYEGDTVNQDDMENRILESPLEVSVRSDWHTPGENAPDAEYLVLLCTGGPAVRIVGELGKYGEPDTARLQYQDWGTPWTDYPLSQEEESDLVEYAQYFGFDV